MPYDPKKRPVFLGLEANRTNPNRLSTGVFTVADQNENKVEVVNPTVSPLSGVLAILKIVGLVLAAAAGAIIAAQASGVVLPAGLVSVATAIVAIAAPLGLASPGLKSLQGDKK